MRGRWGGGGEMEMRMLKGGREGKGTRGGDGGKCWNYDNYFCDLSIEEVLFPTTFACHAKYLLNIQHITLLTAANTHKIPSSKKQNRYFHGYQYKSHPLPQHTQPQPSLKPSPSSPPKPTAPPSPQKTSATLPPTPSNSAPSTPSPCPRPPWAQSAPPASSSRSCYTASA